MFATTARAASRGVMTSRATASTAPLHRWCAPTAARALHGSAAVGKPDPERLVIVCMSGYNFSSFALDPEVRSLALQDAVASAVASGEDPAAAVAQFELAEREEEATREAFLAEAAAADTDADAEIRALGSGSTGMQKLAKRLRKDLAPLGVQSDNILYRRWSTRGHDGANDEPRYNHIAADIEERDPETLVLLGHSYGAWTACRLSRRTVIPPTYIGLLDPMFSYRFTWPIKSGAQSEHQDNYPRGGSIRSWYQKGGAPYGLRHVKMKRDGRTVSVGNHYTGGCNHTSIDELPLLHNSISAAMKQLLDGVTDWSDDGDSN